MKKVAYIPNWFLPKQEFKKILGNKSGIVHDENIISYIENHLEEVNGRMVCKGMELISTRPEFLCTAEVLEVDETRYWRLNIDDDDRPYIQYLDVTKDDFGRLIIKPSKE